MKKLITLLIIIGLTFFNVGCQEKSNDTNKSRLTNPNDDVPVP